MCCDVCASIKIIFETGEIVNAQHIIPQFTPEGGEKEENFTK